MWAEQRNFTSTWNRIEWRTEWEGKKIVPGYAYLRDHNQNRDKLSKEYLPVANAFYFDEQVAYLRNAQAAPFTFLLEHRYRKDKQAQGVAPSSI